MKDGWIKDTEMVYWLWYCAFLKYFKDDADPKHFFALSVDSDIFLLLATTSL